MDAGGAPGSGDASREGIFRGSAAHLLAALVVFVAAGPFVERLEFAAFAQATLLTLVLALGVLAIGARRRTRWIAAGLAIPAVAARWLHHTSPESFPATLYLSFALALVAFVVAQVLGHVLTARRVDAEVLCLGVANYLLLGILWSFAYLLESRVEPHAFADANGAVRSQGLHGFSALYFSFVTLSTVGYGDFAPVSDTARMLAMTEAVAGTFYVAILISRLVALYSTGRESG